MGSYSKDDQYILHVFGLYWIDIILNVCNFDLIDFILQSVDKFHSPNEASPVLDQLAADPHWFSLSVTVITSFSPFIHLFRHDGTDSPADAGDVVVVLNSFHSKIVKVRVSVLLRTFVKCITFLIALDIIQRTVKCWFKIIVLCLLCHYRCRKRQIRWMKIC